MLLQTLLLTTLLSVPDSVGPPPPRMPLVTLAAVDDDEEAAEGEDEGCLETWLCYMPPSSAQSTPWIADNGIKYIIIRDVFVFGLAFFSVPFVGIWLPIVMHFLYVDEEVRPEFGDMLVPLLVWPIASALIAIATVPLNFLPLGVFAYIVLNGGMNYWIIPVTTLHYYNRLQKQMDDGDTKKKKKKRKPKARRRALEDEEDEDVVPPVAPPDPADTAPAPEAAPTEPATEPSPVLE